MLRATVARRKRGVEGCKIKHLTLRPLTDTHYCGDGKKMYKMGGTYK